MQEPERYLQGSVIALMIGAFLLTTISLTSCKRWTVGGHPNNLAGSAVRSRSLDPWLPTLDTFRTFAA
jgi:hypothetical protein